MIHKTIDLHPTKNGGEKTIAHVTFDPQGRIMTLRLEMRCYGSHCSDIRVIFNNPDQMFELADVLKDVAEAALEELKKNP